MNEPQASRPGFNWQVFDASELTRYEADWNALVAASGYPAFMRAGFIGEAVRYFGCAGGRLLFGRVRGRLAVAALLVPRGWGRWESFQPSQLPLGAILVSPNIAWQDLLPSMRRALPGPVISLTVTQQDPLFVGRPVSDARLEVADYVATGWIEVRDTFETFWEARGKNLRQNLRKQRRRIVEQHGPLEFDYLDKPADVDAALLEFAVLESAGWKAVRGSAVGRENAQGNFYRSVLADSAGRGEGFAFRLGLHGRAIAVDFGLRDAETLVLLKTTYDEQFKAYSPAQLLHEQAFESIFNHQQVRRIEFYGRFMEWHARWTGMSRMLYQLTYFQSAGLRSMRNAIKRLQAKRNEAASVPVPE